MHVIKFYLSVIDEAVKSCIKTNCMLPYSTLRRDIYEPLTSHGHILYKSVCGLHKPIRIYTGLLILGINTLYTVFCLV